VAVEGGVHVVRAAPGRHRLAPAQANIYKDTYFEPAISYIQTPGESPSFESAWALTMRIIVLF
jgi:hypothetical protein